MTRPVSFLGVPIHRWLLLVLVLAALTVLSTFIRDELDLEWTVQSLRSAIENAGIWGPILYVGILMFRFAVLVPSSILLTGAGVCFGPEQGTLYATIGLTLSALMKFGFASIVGRDFLLRQVPEKWQPAVALVDRRSTATGLALICAYPLGPNHVFQIAAILSGIPLGRYIIAVAVGGAFRAAAFSFFGEALVSGDELIFFSSILAAIAFFPLLIPSWRRWLFSPSNSMDGTTLKEAA